jgi:hypothetical protein
MTRFELMRNMHKQLFKSPKTLLISPKALIHTYPRIYLAFVTIFALLGYAAVLLSPALLLTGLVSIFQAFTVNNAIDWINVLLWLLISVISGLICYRSMQYKPVAPVGLTLIEDKAPDLFNLVEQVREHYKRPKIHRIIITSDYQLDIVKTPHWALPVWSMNTLMIGLPALQCLSAKHFECLLARRFGQFSKRNNPLTNWLYQLRAIWPQYHKSYTKQKTPGIEPLRWFFAVYAPLYTYVSVHAARRDELNGDAYAMELYNDEVVREMITTDAVCRYYLQSRYWPAVNKIATLETKSPPAPHKKMAAAVLANLKEEKLQEVVNETFQAASDPADPVPALQDRIQNIGHDHPHMNDFRNPSAAVQYLGSALNIVTTIVDKLWLQTWLENRKKHSQQPREQVMATQTTDPDVV